jgi:hypothetical protein
MRQLPYLQKDRPAPAEGLASWPLWRRQSTAKYISPFLTRIQNFVYLPFYSFPPTPRKLIFRPLYRFLFSST